MDGLLGAVVEGELGWLSIGERVACLETMGSRGEFARLTFTFWVAESLFWVTESLCWVTESW